MKVQERTQKGNNKIEQNAYCLACFASAFEEDLSGFCVLGSSLLRFSLDNDPPPLGSCEA